MSLATTPAYTPERITQTDEHAIVIGASMAGLLAARVLTDRYASVTVLDRDPLPDDAVSRRGVPQSDQPHTLLEGGRATIENLLPGFEAAVVAEGGVTADVVDDIVVYQAGEPTLRPDVDRYYLSATRGLFDAIARRKLREVDGVDIRDETGFTGYLTDSDDSTVIGVRVRDADGQTADIEAALVVDATGRASRTPTWLEANGYERPRLEEVNIDLVYSTVLVERPPENRRMIAIPATHPYTRGGLLVPVEGDRWVVNVHGLHGDHPPGDLQGVHEFAAGLATPVLSDLLAAHVPVDETVHRFPIRTSQRYRYDELDRFPDGLVVVGDAIASFNPIYAQGMSVAALQALWLHNILAEGDGDLATRFFPRAAEIVDIAWMLSAGPDFRHPETTGDRPSSPAVVRWYVSRLVERSAYDPVLKEAFGRLLWFEEPPTSLFRPSILWRVLRPGRSRSKPAADPTATSPSRTTNEK